MSELVGKESADTEMEANVEASALVAFWGGAAVETGYREGDLRAGGKTADPTAMLPYVDHDHSGVSDPRFWGDELRQKEFENRRKRDSELEARRSRNAAELHGIPAARRIEEQVVGSTHRFVIARPYTSNGLTALITPSVRSSGDDHHGFSALLPPTSFHVVDDQPGAEIAVQFEPQKAGRSAAELVLEVRWTDGSVDTRVVDLDATARLRTEIPEDEVPVSPNAQFREAADFGWFERQSPEAPTPEQKAVASREFAQLSSDVRQKANTLVERQIDGVNMAGDEARSYSRKPPETSLFTDLIQLAVSMGIAGVAGIVARQLAVKLAARFGKGKDSSLAIGLTDGIKEGMKKIGNGGAAKLLGDNNRQDESTIDSEASTNPRIAFFAQQTMILRDLADENQELVSAQAGRLMPLLETDPETAVSALRALYQAFDEAAGALATREQARASTYQWVAAVARASLGSTTASTHDRSYAREVADLSKYTEGTDGVLTIDVTQSGDDVNVTGADIRGVSQEVANRLAHRSLRHAGIPLRLRVRTGSSIAIVSVDEARRLRVTGYLDQEDVLPLSEYVGEQNMPEQLEAQATSRAEAIVAVVLAKSLNDWGVRVTSDDATQNGDSK